MTPLHFGPPERRLFGIWHRREADSPSRAGVILAAPFGHEAIRTHRMYRVLAGRLARLGHDVLRFDWYGSGDSDGDDGDATLGGWAGDIAVADAALSELVGRAPGWWMGARLGGSAAVVGHPAHGRADAAGAPPSGPALLLWDPVVDGAAYLDELRQLHVRALERSFSVVDRAWRRRLDDPAAYADEAIGFAIAPGLRAEIAALTPEALRLGAGTTAAVVASPGARAALAWAASQRPELALVRLAREFEWLSDDSLDTALVPAEAVAALLAALRGSAA